MSTTTDGWIDNGPWSEHRDGSLIQRTNVTAHGLPWDLYRPDGDYHDSYKSIPAAKRAHAEYVADRAEARELRRSKT